MSEVEQKEAEDKIESLVDNKSQPGEKNSSVSEAKDSNEFAAYDLPPLSEEELIPALEALLFASSEPIDGKKLCRLLSLHKENFKILIENIKAKHESITSGFEILEVAGGYQLRTKQKFGLYVRALRAEKPKRLSSAALETLAVIAYRQPIVKSDIETIRGVDSTPTIKTLIERGFIRIIGHQQTVGAPALYGTTDEFLKIFGLKDLTALPTLREIRMIEDDPGEEGEEYGEEKICENTETTGSVAGEGAL